MTTHRYDPANMDRLLAPERYEELDIHRIFSLLPLSVYQVVADIGCGPGFFTIPLAKVLMHGKVYALDIEEEMVEECRRRVREARLGNVEMMINQAKKFPIAAGTLDGALLSLVLHSQVDKVGFLKKVKGLLRPHGWVMMINWHLVPQPAKGPPPERRIAVEEVLRVVEKVGLRVTVHRELNQEQYLLVLSK